MKTKSLFTMIALSAMAAVSAAAVPRTNNWVSLTGGNWSDTSKWADTSFYPNGTNDVAIISSRPPNNDDVTTAPTTTITLDVPVTLGELLVRNRKFTIAAATGKKLTMAATGKSALIRTYERIAGVTGDNLFNTSVHIATDTEILAGDMGLKFATTSFLTSSDDGVTVTLNMNTPSQGDALLELGNNSGFTGKLAIKRDSTGGAGCTFATTDARFPAGPVRVESSGYARFAAPLTDARIAQLTMQPGATLLFRSTASVAGCSSAGLPKFLDSTKLTLGDTSTTVKDRWGNADALDLNGTQLSFSGPTTSSSIEKVGASTYKKGAVMYLKGSAAAYQISLESDSLARIGNGTLVIISDSATWYVGTASSKFKIGSPVLTDSRFPACMVMAKREGTTSATLLLPYLCGYDATYNSVIPLPYALTNSFGTAQQTVLVTNTLNLGGATVDAFAVAGGITGSDGNYLYNGTVRIASGFLAMKGNFYRFGANFIMGANGTGEALIYVVGSSSGDFRRLDGLTGPVSCNDFTKFGPGIVRLSGNNTNLFGTIRVNQGNLALDASQAVRNTNDVWLCAGGRLTVSADSVRLGGLSSDVTAILQMEYASGATTLSLNPPAATEHVFQGTVQNSGTVNVMMIEIAGKGIQGFSGIVGSPISVKTGGTLKVVGDVGSTLCTSALNTFTLTAASSLPATVVLTDPAVAEGTYVLIASPAGLSGSAPALDASATDFPAGKTPALRISSNTLILEVQSPRGTLFLVR
jgi:hypothetical protein